MFVIGQRVETAILATVFVFCFERNVFFDILWLAGTPNDRNMFNSYDIVHPMQNILNQELFVGAPPEHR